MLILSSFDNDKQFIEILNTSECENVESDCYAYISIDSVLPSNLEKYFKIAKSLHKNEVKYAVLLNDRASYHVNYFESATKKEYLASFDEEVSLQFILSMFAKYGASFFIFDESDYDLLPLAQSYANYHLLDMKILGLVDSYKQAGSICTWSGGNRSKDMNKSIHIDGVVEKSLLVKHKTKS